MGSIVSVMIVICWLLVVFSTARKRASAHKGTSGAFKSTGSAQAHEPAATSRTVRENSSPKMTSPTSQEGSDPCHTSIRYTEVPEEAFYAGSMNADSPEGVDPCHNETLSQAPIPEDAQTDHVAESLLTPSDLARAFVLSEILRRPSERTCGKNLR